MFRFLGCVVAALIILVSVAQAEPSKNDGLTSKASCVVSQALDNPFTIAIPKTNKSEPQQCSKSSKDGSMELARRGCCSHHGGVCGCSSGRAVCCDGAYSPSCGCD